MSCLYLAYATMTYFFYNKKLFLSNTPRDILDNSLFFKCTLQSADSQTFLKLIKTINMIQSIVSYSDKVNSK